MAGPQNLTARTAQRGFPVFDASGQTGQGALPDSTLPGGQAPGAPSGTWTDPNTDPGSVAAVPAPPEDYVLGQSLWGLPGAQNPDDTPRTHAAPFADPTLPAPLDAEELLAVHGPEFTGVSVRRHPPTLPQFGFGQQAAEGGSGSGQQPLTGQIRSLGGFDAVQGYGGGADGPGGVNADMPMVTLDRQFPGPEGRPVFTSAAEVPLYVADALQFIPAAPELPAWAGGGFDAPLASVSAQDSVSADVPLTGPPLAPAGGLLPLWGS